MKTKAAVPPALLEELRHDYELQDVAVWGGDIDEALDEYASNHRCSRATVCRALDFVLKEV